MKRRRWTVAGLAVVVAVYVAWPYFAARPALLAEAQKDVFTFADVTPVEQLQNRRIVQVGEVVLLREGLRLRVVSDSHHNMFIGYSGTTYVNLNNRVFFRSGGHCGQAWIAPFEDVSAVTEQAFARSLAEAGYRQVAGPK